MGDHPIERRFFNTDRIDQFIDRMIKAGCNERSVWNHCISIQSILNWGYRQYDDDDKRIIPEPIDFEIPKKPKTKPVLYTTEEVFALENAILQEYLTGLESLRESKKNERKTSRMARELLGSYLLYKAIFLVKNTGMREGEVLHLPYEHILLNRGEIIISDFANRFDSSSLHQTSHSKGLRGFRRFFFRCHT